MVMNALQMPDQKKKRFIFDLDDTDEDNDFAASLEPFANNAIQRSAFTGASFNADQYLTNRRHLGLAGLKTELNGHLRQLKSQLVELINRDYADFVNLSTNLKGLDKVMANLQNPIQDMRSQVKVVSERLNISYAIEVTELTKVCFQTIREEMQNVIDALENSLQDRAQVREHKVCVTCAIALEEGSDSQISVVACWY